MWNFLLGVFAACFLLTEAAIVDPTETHQGKSGFRFCPRCFHYRNADNSTIPQFWQDMIGLIPDIPENNASCAGLADDMPREEWQDCGEPMLGEGNSCIYLNVTVIMKQTALSRQFLETVGVLEKVAEVSHGVLNNLGGVAIKVTDILNTGDTGKIGAAAAEVGNILGRTELGGQVVNTLKGATADAAAAISGANIGGIAVGATEVVYDVGKVVGHMQDGNTGGALGAAGAGLGAAIGKTEIGKTVATSLTNVNTEIIKAVGGLPMFKLPPWGSFGKRRRRRRDVLEVLSRKKRDVVTLLGGVNKAANNWMQTGQLWSPDYQNPIPKDGEFKLQLYWKGCVRQSLLETLASSHCKIHPQAHDVRLFGGQSMMKPLLDVMDKFQSIPQIGLETTIEGLCYMMDDEATKLLWAGLFGYKSLDEMGILSGDTQNGGLVGTIVDSIGKTGGDILAGNAVDVGESAIKLATGIGGVIADLG